MANAASLDRSLRNIHGGGRTGMVLVPPNSDGPPGARCCAAAASAVRPGTAGLRIHLPPRGNRDWAIGEA